MAPPELSGPASAPEVGPLVKGAVDVLPEGRLAEQLAEGRPLRVKFGVDPTSPDIHLGHCVVLTKLRAFQDAGHTVVLIIGDYTARVGDPSGRDTTRPVLSAADIEANAQTYLDQAFAVLDRQRTEIRHNSEWLEMGSDELFGLVRRFTVARLLEREDFGRRMAEAQPISVLELLYPVLQGYDSVAVEADLELGGTDQTFNLLFGRDVQAAYGQTPQAILTMPILPGTDGVQKMSKSYGNYVGVNDPPEEMFGKLMSIPDDVMGEYWLLLLGEELERARHPNEAKRELARRLTDRFHGEGAGAGAEARFDQVHVRGEIPDEIPAARLDAADGELVHLPALISAEFGLSRGEARRLIQQGGVRLDGSPVDGHVLDLPAGELAGRVLQVGKRRFVRIVAPAGDA
ncbi:MAG TPA: tyrosine--tRNA ligase [Solirubrobacterales bacterium]|nr:tyrosine--tRNA ligase [Solirubrobacterales bacterium]